MKRLAAGVLAVSALALAGFLAVHHPLSPAAASGSVLLLTALAFALPTHWPLWSLALWPLLGLMPWTGWLLVEEMDMVLLAAAAGAYGRWAAAPTEKGADAAGAQERSSAQALWMLPLAAAMAVSTAVGISDAGGLRWGWWQGYREPLNSVRLFKPMLWALLLLPLCCHGLSARASPARNWEKALLRGMLLLLLGVSLSVWWERWAYTGLLDFSSDYRATGLFWEMHVGGAALDAALALSMPFAWLAWTKARSPWRWAAAGTLLGLAAYAALVTFSRIVYLAVPLGMGLTWWLAKRQQVTPAEGAKTAWAGLGCLAFGVVGLAFWLFPVGGYRSLLALLGALALLLPLAAPARRAPARAWGQALVALVPAVVLVAAAAHWVPKGAYLAYALAWVCCALLLWRGHRKAMAASPVLLSGFGAVCAALVAVGVHWGGALAWLPGTVAAVGLLLALVLAAGWPQPVWPVDWQGQGQALGGLVSVTVLVAVFSGGDYMSQRVTQTREDSAGRQEHWRKALSWLEGADWLAGKGLGRFPAQNGLSGNTKDQVGDYRLAPGPREGGQVLVLTGGKHTLGHGELFRLAQRIPAPVAGPLKLELRIRAQQATALHVEVCTKHLLYPQACVDRNVDVAQPADDWQPMSVLLEGPIPDPGTWFAPRWLVFAVALGTPGRRVELDALDLRDGRGQPLLENGDFERGMARWFTTSDRHHMPWHAKNLPVHVVFEQGLLGLAAWVLALSAALWRLTAGAARAHPLAPALAGSLLGVLVVGMVDSLLDMPRVGWLMLFLLGVALSLPGAGKPWRAKRRDRPPSHARPRAP